MPDLKIRNVPKRADFMVEQKVPRPNDQVFHSNAPSLSISPHLKMIYKIRENHHLIILFHYKLLVIVIYYHNR